MEIDIRLTIPDEVVDADGTFDSVALLTRMEDRVIHNIIAEIPEVQSAVLLRNKGFGHLLPDESTRQER